MNVRLTARDETTPTSLNRLRWQCRRGMRELDELLLAFLDARGEALDEGQRALVARLLEFPDPLLLDWLMGEARPMDPALAEAIDLIRPPRA